MNTTEKKIKMLLAQVGKSQKDIADIFGITQPALNQKLKRETLKREDLQKIAQACNASYKAVFILEDGTEI